MQEALNPHIESRRTDRDVDLICGTKIKHVMIVFIEKANNNCKFFDGCVTAARCRRPSMQLDEIVPPFRNLFQGQWQR